jgi:hypothetical protein
MTIEMSLVDSALRTWQQNVERAGSFFTALSDEQLLLEVAPGKNRLRYLWGHLAASSDTLLPLLGLGQRLHPELDAAFLLSPDRTVADTLSAVDLKRIWTEIHETLWTAFSGLSASDWLQKHASVSAEDFRQQPHRNRFTVLQSRTAHIAYHLGQAMLAPRAR